MKKSKCYNNGKRTYEITGEVQETTTNRRA